MRVDPGGVLADYVPFYFAPRSPMLGAIHIGKVEGYTEGQEPVLHLVSSAEAWVQMGNIPVFTDGHAIIQLSDFFNDLQHLNRIDWKITQERYWHDTDDDNDRTRRREAEFLAHQFFPWPLISEIGVMTNAMAKAVNEVLKQNPESHRPVIATRRNWYY